MDTLWKVLKKFPYFDSTKVEDEDKRAGDVIEAKMKQYFNIPDGINEMKWVIIWLHFILYTLYIIHCTLLYLTAKIVKQSKAKGQARM